MMTLFWICAAAMVVAALLMITRALLGKKVIENQGSGELNIDIARERLAELEAAHRDNELSDEEFAQVKQELELALADDLDESLVSDSRVQVQSGTGRITLLVFAVLLPALAFGLYFKLGTPGLVGHQGAPQQAAAHAGAGQQPTSIEELLGKLEKRLQANPEDPDGWFMLGRTYMSLQRYPEAMQAYEKLRGVVGDVPDALIPLADATAMVNGGRMQGKPLAWVKKVLETDPENITGLWLAGKGAIETGDYQVAVDYWKRARPLLQDKPEVLAQLDQQIADAEQKGGIASSAPQANKSPAPVVAAGPGIRAQVALDGALMDQVKPEDIIFIFATAEQGPPMPLAAVRKQVKDLPLDLVLDDSMAMMPEMAISKHKRVKVSARVALGGQPTAQSGDFQSVSVVVDVGAEAPVQLLINTRVP